MYPGTNGTYTANDAAKVFEHFGPGDWIVQQNEISQGGEIMQLAAEKGLQVLFNPAPLTPGIVDAFPFDKVTILVVNEHEAADLNKEIGGPENAQGLNLAGELLNKFPKMQGVVVTLGGDGVVAKFRQEQDGRVRDFIVPGRKANVKDTTGAGDTFVVSGSKAEKKSISVLHGRNVITLKFWQGFFLAAFVRSEKDDYFVRVQRALEEANVAASIAVEREGSMISVPTLDEVRQRQAGNL